MNDDKKKLYDQILKSLDDWQVLFRMRELGYWPEGMEIPEEPQEAQAERAALLAELGQLRKKSARIANPEAALAEERVRRWHESKKRRALQKAERLAKKKERALAWQAERGRTIVHAGQGVSAGLADTSSDAAKLGEAGLPIIHDAAGLAEAMGTTLTRLRWLTYHRRAATVLHYHRYTIPKKTGGVRAISAPKRELAEAQRWVLEALLEKIAPTDRAHGFVKGRSVVTNATPHVKKAVVINLDLKDFFPTLTFRRVKGLFAKQGYSEHVATVLALLTTEPPRARVELDSKVYGVALGERVLPQGACTSPAITNIVCRGLDRRLAGLAHRHGFVFTRYADDLTFSGDDRRKVGLLLGSARSIITDEGFTEHPKKTRVMGRGRRQEVTGVTVNERVALSREEKRALRALLHNCAKRGLASQNRNDHADFPAYLRGRVAWASMLEPERAADWKRRLAAALEKRPA